jgi:predicted nucleotidyltransferase
MGASRHIREHRDEILRVAALHGAGNVLLFGSVPRGEDTPVQVVIRRSLIPLIRDEVLREAAPL